MHALPYLFWQTICGSAFLSTGRWRIRTRSSQRGSVITVVARESSRLRSSIATGIAMRLLISERGKNSRRGMSKKRSRCAWETSSPIAFYKRTSVRAAGKKRSFFSAMTASAHASSRIFLKKTTTFTLWLCVTDLRSCVAMNRLRKRCGKERCAMSYPMIFGRICVRVPINWSVSVKPV